MPNESHKEDCPKHQDWLDGPSIEPLQLAGNEAVADLIDNVYARSGFNARRLAAGARLYRRMIDDNATIGLTIAGAMTPIGMSGLLVKSTVIMKDNLEVLNERHITAPVILGGAALTRSYVEGELRSIYHGKLDYAKDAFAGLALMDEITSGKTASQTTTRRIPPKRRSTDPGSVAPLLPTRCDVALVVGTVVRKA